MPASTFFPSAHGRTSATAPRPASRPGARAAGAPAFLLPGNARLLLLAEGARVAALIGNRFYDRLDPATLLGPSSMVARLWVDGAPPAEVALDAADWPALTGTPAERVANRVVAPDALAPGLLRDAADGYRPGAPGALRRIANGVEAALAAAAPHAPADENDRVARALAALLRAGGAVSAGEAADLIGVEPQLLRRLANRRFGFPPKVLLTRERFLLALGRFERGGVGAAVDGSYHDASHFLRDADRFLGMTPRRFLRMVEEEARS